MTATPTSGQRRLLEQSIKDGGVAGIPTSYYRKALDLNRFSNTVANKLLESYRRQIVKAVRELERIDKMPSSKKPQFKAARMRALIKQNLDSMRSWSNSSVEDLIKQLDGLADVEVAFATGELQRAVPAGMKTSVRTVEVTESFARSVVSADPLDVGTNLLQQNIEEAVKGPGALMKLTARQGAIIRMPDGTSVKKAFRGLAERQGELFSRAVLDGLLTGESTAAIARSLYGELGFSTEALTPRQVALAQTGNAWKMAKHQVRTLVRTSVNATANAASQQVYRANPEVTKKYRWVATLDNRTSPICRNLDQSVYEYGKGPTPANPPHFNCRSTTIPIIDYEGLGLSTPPNTQGYRPTTESRPNSRDPDGGRVPVNVSAAQHIYDLRGTTKSGRKSKYEPSAAQARMLNGGRDTAAGRQKARYFNRLADRYGPDGAMKRFMRTDGTEVSLQQLQQRYGKPDKITTTKPKPKPKATTQDLRDELERAKAKTAAAKAAADKAKAKADRTRRELEAETRRQEDASLQEKGKRLLADVAPEVNSFASIERKAVRVMQLRAERVAVATTQEERLAAIKKYNQSRKIQERANLKLKPAMQKIRQAMLKTNLTKAEQKRLLKNVAFDSKDWGTTRALKAQMNEHKEMATEFIQMFNGKGFDTYKGRLGAAKMQPDLFGRGSFNPNNRVVSVRMKSKENTFHELMHVVEMQRPEVYQQAYAFRWKNAYAADSKMLGKDLRPKAVKDKDGKPLFKLRDLTEADYGEQEIAYADDFQNVYMGKVYPDGSNATEVLTVAAESFVSADRMSMLARKHPDLFQIMVGLSQTSRFD